MLMKILFALIALTVIVPVALYYKSGKTKGKECLLMNAISFFSILGVGVICTLGGGVRKRPLAEIVYDTTHGN